MQGWQWLSILSLILLLHLSFWLILLTTSPHSRHIQSLIWHPQRRKLLGFGYIDFLLTALPPLRHHLLAPFRDTLLADANLYNFDSQAYFANSHVQIKGATHTQPIQTAIANIQSPIVIEGESGLGKSMFLRHHVKTCQRLCVYLRATQCAEGVIRAIQSKLPLANHDSNFLKSLIYHNALDICIDGLNEVTPDTRANISSFCDRHFQGHILLTTQPLEWTPPATAKTYTLQPLKRQQIKEFLISRQAILPEDASISGVNYEEACQDYLQEILNSQQSKDELTAVRRFLSNPMDLTLVAQLLAQGKEPDLLNLQQQQYQLMAAEYQQHHFRSFPLQTFAETVYQMRLNDQIAIPNQPWQDELQCLERHINNKDSVQHNYPSEQKQTLAEAAVEIQTLLQQLEATNPNATESEKTQFVNLAIPPSKRQRFLSAIESGGKEAFKELLDNPYINVGVAIVEGWQNP